jgi:L-iditol 2-dehydrogenase
MRVAMYYSNRDVRVEELPIPAIGPNELLVRVRASGICGTDVLEWYRTQKAPLVLGHEITGEVTAVGEGVEGFEVGDRVFVSHHVPCGACRYCLAGHETVCDTLRKTHFDPGGFAEYVRVPEINVRLGTFRLPRELSFEEGAFIEPLACVVRGQRAARLQPGQSVLVIGCGTAGLLHIQAARVREAARVLAVDISDFRLRAARKLGADAAIRPEEVHSKLRGGNDGRLADLVIVCTGAVPAIEQATQSVERGGTILFFAPAPGGVKVPIPLYEFWRDEVTIATSYAASPRDLAEAIDLLRSRRVQVLEMITHRLPLDATGIGFELVADARDSLKVIIEPDRSAARDTSPKRALPG